MQPRAPTLEPQRAEPNGDHQQTQLGAQGCCSSRSRPHSTRFGLHFIEVRGLCKGKLPEFEAVQQRMQAQLALQSRSTALGQYMQLLVGQARVEGIELEGADSPLVQ